MTVREANQRIATINSICKEIQSSYSTQPPTHLYEAIDLLQEYKNALLRAINKAEVVI